MCTVSVLRGPWIAWHHEVDRPEWRLICSRDEQRSRPAALPPAIGRIGMRAVASPLDPEGPGTWIAATDAGLAFVLLNRSSECAPPATPVGICVATDGRISRGRIIPMLVGAASLEDVQVRARHLGPLRTRPFTLLVAADQGMLEYVSDGDTLQGRTLLATPRLLRTSSSIDGVAVAAWRSAAFEGCVLDGDAVAQVGFHHLTNPEAPHRGVLMARPDACTVSITRIDMYASRVRVDHDALAVGGSVAVLDVARVDGF